MSTKDYKSRAIFALIIVALVALAVFCTLFLEPKINPVALTRHAIEQCERIENGVMPGITGDTTANDIANIYGLAIKGSKTFNDGYIKVSEDSMPKVMDSWGQPLQMMSKSNLLNIPNASPILLHKTNFIIIWSCGPNGSNEFGNGDDVFILPENFK